LDRYLRVRRGLEPAVREVTRQRAAFAQEKKAMADGSGLGVILNASSLSSRWMESENAFLRSLLAELEREKMSPQEMKNLIALVDWRFLRRREALVFGLPEYQRADWVDAQEMLSYPMPTASGEEGERWRREQSRRRALTQAEAEALEKEATAAVALSPAPQALLADRRADLEALDSAALDRILRGLDPNLASEGFWDEE
jgi:hypothetical protein